jgi:putative transferase (TIGR04331 family)
MVKRFLVTTALEETWPEETVPVLFLGEWCRLYDRKSVWEKLDAVVAPYHWDDRKKLHQDYFYIQSLYEGLLVELAEKLNTLHHVNYTIRYWRIIIGPWLGYFVQMLYDRWAMLRQVVSDYNIVGVRVVQQGEYSHIPNDMSDFNQLYIGDAWNEMIYGQILEWLNIPIEYVSGKDNSVTHASKVSESNNSRGLHGVRRMLINFFTNLSLFARNNDFFLIASCIPPKQELLFQLKLGQFPNLWRTVATPSIPINHNLRQWSLSKNENANDFISLVRAMIPRHIPMAYLEGYKELLAITEHLPWPKTPKAIFTSVSYFSDEVFKIWAANKVDGFTPLVIGQNGGNYGSALWIFYEDHLLAISDCFITWGWSRQADGHCKAIGNFKVFSKKQNFDPEGFALLVEVSIPRYSYWMYSIPLAGQHLEYLEEQYRFVQALPKYLQDQVLVRLYSYKYGWCDKERFQERFPEIRFDAGQPMVSLIEKSRLYIGTYNATTYLESMSLNIPTIIFWNPKYWELRDSAIPYFERLKSVGIFHETPESAAKQMTAVWDDVSSWWDSQAVQSVRKEFCDRYTHILDKPLESMEKLFTELSEYNADE